MPRRASGSRPSAGCWMTSNPRLTRAPETEAEIGGPGRGFVGTLDPHEETFAAPELAQVGVMDAGSVRCRFPVCHARSLTEAHAAYQFRRRSWIRARVGRPRLLSCCAGPRDRSEDHGICRDSGRALVGH